MNIDCVSVDIDVIVDKEIGKLVEDCLTSVVTIRELDDWLPSGILLLDLLVESVVAVECLISFCVITGWLGVQIVEGVLVALPFGTNFLAKSIRFLSSLLIKSKTDPENIILFIFIIIIHDVNSYYTVTCRIITGCKGFSQELRLVEDVKQSSE